MTRWLCALLLAGCTAGPDYQRPAVDLPPAYHRAPHGADARSVADLPWWQAFGDPELAGLVREALGGNLDLAVAAAQIEQARAQVALARSGSLPQLAARAGVTRANEKLLLAPMTSWIAALALSWEIDLWGRYRRATEAARAELLASEAARDGIIVSLVAGVAQQYLTLNGLEQRLAIVRDTAASERDSLELVKLLAKQGVQSAAEVRQAETQLLATESSIPSIERDIAQSEDALATLLGKPPRSFTVPAELPPRAVPPEVPAGLPSALLERRPDIRAAEQDLIAANANIGVARAAFFPAITLTGAFGRASPSLAGLAGSEGRTTRSAGATADAPLYGGGALTANEALARGREQEAQARYRRTIVVALQEVNDALAAYQASGIQVDTNRRRVESAAESLKLAGMRFRSGVISFLEVLDAQRQLLAAHLDLNSAALDHRLVAVQLYKALGGGWNP